MRATATSRVFRTLHAVERGTLVVLHDAHTVRPCRDPSTHPFGITYEPAPAGASLWIVFGGCQLVQLAQPWSPGTCLGPDTTDPTLAAPLLQGRYSLGLLLACMPLQDVRNAAPRWFGRVQVRLVPLRLPV